MVWIRVDDTLMREPFIGALADAVGTDLPTAMGLWVATTLGFATYEKTGEADRATDQALERWAGWQGERGKYASAFRGCCVERADGQPDLPGVLKTWWRQEALLNKAQVDAARLRDARAAHRASLSRVVSGDGSAMPPATVARSVAGSVARNDDDDNNGTKQVVDVVGAREPVDPTRYAQRCVIACNTGLRANTLLPGFNELVASAQDIHRDWIAAGIDADVAERTIYACAVAYRPRQRARQPATLAYFDRPVRDAHEREQARRAEPSGNLAAAVLDGQLTEGERLARDLTREIT